MTDAQQKVINRLKEIGGAGWLGDGVDRASGKFVGFAPYCKDIKRFWGSPAFMEWKAAMKKHGVTDKGVWCSNVTRNNLLNADLIVAIAEVPGAWKLTEHGWTR